MTTLEYIRSCSVDEAAEFMNKQGFGCPYVDGAGSVCSNYEWDCHECWKAWLCAEKENIDE